MSEIQVARDGQTIGQYTAEQLSQAVAAGAVLSTDFAWYDGLAEWVSVSEVLASLSPALPAKQKKAKAPKEPKPVKDWRKDAATEKQISYLASFGQIAKAGMTKGEASELIDKLSEDPKALARQEKIQQEKYEQQRKERGAFPSYFLRKDITETTESLEHEKRTRDKLKEDIAENTKKLQALQKQTGKAEEVEEIKEEIESSKSDLTDAADSIKDAQEELKEHQSTRVNFWKATFKKDVALSLDDDALFNYTEAIDKLYVAFGRYFKTPTSKQTADILAALDAASPEWDKAQPHAFYATLQGSFPEMQKSTGKGKAPVAKAPPAGERKVSVSRAPVKAAANKGSGCLVLIALPILFYGLVRIIA